MNIAFSTLSTPTWDYPTIAAKAKEFGYAGVELFGQLNTTLENSSQLFSTPLSGVAEPFAAHGIAIAAVACSVSMTGKAEADELRHDQLITFIDKAAALKAPILKIADIRIKPGQNRGQASSAFGDWLVPLGDYAASRGVTIAVENLLSIRKATEMWALLDRIGHPAIGCCWDVFNAAQAGEAPAVSVPTLNSRIVHVHLKDAKASEKGAEYCKFGEGDVRLENFLARLRGVGYNGWLSVELEPGALAELPAAEVSLPQAIERIRGWTEPKKVEKKAAASKPVAAAVK